MRLISFIKEKGDSLKKDFFWYLLPTVANFVLGFITFPFIVKNITVSAFGINGIKRREVFTYENR